MKPNRPTEPGWYYKARLNKLGEPFEWSIVRLAEHQSGRLRIVGTMNFADDGMQRHTCWERVPMPSWERDARAMATTDEVAT